MILRAVLRGWATLCFAILLASASSSFAAVDALAFLDARPWKRVEAPAHLLDPYRSLPHEWHVISDEWGNLKVVMLAPEEVIQSMWAAHQMAELAEVGHVPVQPILVRRGTNGIPTMEEAQEISKKGPFPRVEAFVGDNQWHSAVVFPFAFSGNRPGVLTPDRAIQEARLASLLLVLAPSRFSVFQSPEGPLLLEAANLFSNFDRTPDQIFKSWNSDGAGKMEMSYFIRNIERSMGTVATVLARSFEPVFGPYWSLLQSRGIPESTLERIKGRPLEAAGSLQRYLEKKFPYAIALKPKEETGHHLIAPLHYPAGSLRTAKRLGPMFYEEVNRRQVARHAMEYYFRASLKEKKELDPLWVSFYPNLSRSSIGELARVATSHDSHTRLIVSEGRPSSRELNVVRKPFLNSNLHSTLLVYSPNDAEGRAIGELLKAYGPATGLAGYELADEKNLRFYKLEPGNPILEKIVQYAKNEGIKRVIFAEVALPSSGLIAYLNRHGLAANVLDHHSDERYRAWNRQSVVEQVADVIGGSLTMAQWSIAVRDRAGLLGFTEFGITNEELDKILMLAGKGNRTPIMQQAARYEASWKQAKADGVLPIVDDPSDAGLFSTLGTFQYLNYPERVDMIIVQKSMVTMVGSPRFIKTAQNVAERAGAQLYLGGDYSHGLYLRIRINDEWSVRGILNLAKFGTDKPMRRLEMTPYAAPNAACDVLPLLAPTPISKPDIPAAG